MKAHHCCCYGVAPTLLEAGCTGNSGLGLAPAGPTRDSLQGIDHDCNDIPDAAMTLAVAALFAKGPTRIRNVYNWRVKVAFPQETLTPCILKYRANHVAAGFSTG